MPKREYVLAIICFLVIPVLVIATGPLYVLIDPEMARGHTDYVRNYRLWEMARRAALVSIAGLVLLFWIACCYLVLRSRQRSLTWLLLAAVGPFGFAVIAGLKDRSAASDDLYQQFIRNLKIYWRVLLEIVLFVSIWVLAYELVAIKRDLMISYESFSSGRAVADIVAEQSASSGMWAFSEGNQTMYLVILLYLLWPLLFNLAGHLFVRRSSTE